MNYAQGPLIFSMVLRPVAELMADRDGCCISADVEGGRGQNWADGPGQYMRENCVKNRKVWLFHFRRAAR
jgi:hypothetical protein